jgi:hypothetical protein
MIEAIRSYKGFSSALRDPRARSTFFRTVDKIGNPSDNTSMKKLLRTCGLLLTLLPLLLIPVDDLGAAETTSLSTLYWCATRTGNQLQLKSGPGCEPLVEAKQNSGRDDGTSDPKAPTNIANLEAAVSAFLRDYRALLDCCANDVSSIDDISKLEDHASSLIADAVGQLPPAAFLAARNQALVVPVVEARSKLRLLNARLKQMNAAQDQLGGLDYEQSAKERRRLEENDDAITKEFQSTREPARAPTGTGIGRPGSTGEEIGRSGSSGPQIGASPATGSRIGTTPPTLGEIADTSPGQRPDTALGTTEPVTRGVVGPEIGTTPKTGSSIGNSTLNTP